MVLIELEAISHLVVWVLVGEDLEDGVPPQVLAGLGFQKARAVSPSPDSQQPLQQAHRVTEHS